MFVSVYTDQSVPSYCATVHQKAWEMDWSIDEEVLELVMQLLLNVSELESSL